MIIFPASVFFPGSWVFRLYILPAAGFRQGGNVGVLHRCWLYNLLVDDPLCCEAGFNSWRVPRNSSWHLREVLAIDYCGCGYSDFCRPTEAGEKPTQIPSRGLLFEVHPASPLFLLLSTAILSYFDIFCPSVGHCSCRCFGNPGVYGAIRVIHWRGNGCRLWLWWLLHRFSGIAVLFFSQKPKGNRNGSQSRALPGYAVFAMCLSCSVSNDAFLRHPILTTAWIIHHLFGVEELRLWPWPL